MEVIGTPEYNDLDWQYSVGVISVLPATAAPCHPNFSILVSL